MCFWSPDPLAIGGLAAPLLDQALQLMSVGRLQQQPPTGDIRLLSQRYRALLHTPLHGNGTSVVISDALGCGKLVILAPLPAYREAYGTPGWRAVHRPAPDGAGRQDMRVFTRGFCADPRRLAGNAMIAGPYCDSGAQQSWMRTSTRPATSAANLTVPRLTLPMRPLPV